MFFKFGFNNKTVKQLRMERGYTAKELADKLNVGTTLILKVDGYKVKNIPEPLKSILLPILRGDDDNKIPW
ncbi:MAG: helix-turn-helix domain-containing protein [Clostridia bacterium]